MIASEREKEEIVQACEAIRTSYRPAAFDEGWFLSVKERYKNEPNAVAAFRAEKERRSKVSTVGACIRYRRAFYAPSPELCRTIDTSYFHGCFSTAEERSRLDKHLGCRSAFVAPLLRESKTYSPIGVLAVSSPNRMALSIEDHMMICLVAGLLEQALALASSRGVVWQ